MAGFLKYMCKIQHMKKFIKPPFYFFLGIITFAMLFLIYGFEDGKAEKQIKTENFTNQWSVPEIPTTYTFAGEKVPLERQEVREYFDRNFTLIYYQTGTMLNLMKLANRWFPLIEARLKQNN